jgi:uncharacterized protein (DUF433 family)
MSAVEQLRIGDGIFTVKDIAKILNVSNGKARYYVNSYIRDELTKSMQYIYNFEPDIGVFVNFKSVLQLLVFNQLKDKGHKKKNIIRAFKAMSEHFSTKYPFADKIDKIVSAGSDILFLTNSDELVKADSSLQYAMKEILEDLIHKIDFSSEGQALRYFPHGKNNSIVIDPKIQFGSPTIKGTRIDADSIYRLYSSGEDIQTIAYMYDINQKQIKDAIEFSIAA